MADNPPSEIQTLIYNHINAFNTQNVELFLGVFSDDTIILDGIAPYRWLNPNAPTNWLADVEKWRADFQVSSDHLAYEMGFWNVEGSNAYAVVSATLTVTIKGQAAARPARSPIRFQSMAGRGRSTPKRGGAHRNEGRGCLLTPRERPSRWQGLGLAIWPRRASAGVLPPICWMFIVV